MFCDLSLLTNYHCPYHFQNNSDLSSSHSADIWSQLLKSKRSCIPNFTLLPGSAPHTSFQICSCKCSCEGSSQTVPLHHTGYPVQTRVSFRYPLCTSPPSQHMGWEHMATQELYPRTWYGEGNTPHRVVNHLVSKPRLWWYIDEKFPWAWLPPMHCDGDSSSALSAWKIKDGMSSQEWFALHQTLPLFHPRAPHLSKLPITTDWPPGLAAATVNSFSEASRL